MTKTHIAKFQIILTSSSSNVEISDFNITDFDSYYMYFEVNLKFQSTHNYKLLFELNNIFKDNCFDNKIELSHKDVLSVTLDSKDVDISDDELDGICQSLSCYIYLSSINGES